MAKTRNLAFSLIVVAAGALWVSSAAQDMKGGVNHLMVAPEAVAWMPAPASLPKSAMVAVLAGDPSKEGPFTMRLKVPANYTVPPHFHPAQEHVTIIQGTFYMGLGETFDEAKLRMIPTGGFGIMNMGTRHFARSGNTETIVQLHGMGPWGITYVKDSDDPRKQGG